MAVKIIIKRKVPQEKAADLMPYLKQLRVLAMNQPGYIGGETLKRIDDPEEYLVISTWQDVKDWNVWFNHEKRSEIQNQIDNLLGEKTEYGVYTYR